MSIVWRIVPRFPRYEISACGKLRDAVTHVALTPSTTTGYATYNFADKSKKRFMRSIHRMMWEAHMGAIPEGLQINHKNGIKLDNTLANLEVVTIGENVRHAHMLGLSPTGDRHWKRRHPELVARGSELNWSKRPWTRARGERHGLSKLTADNVRSIRARHADGASCTALSRQFGVSITQICNIVKRKVWREI